MENFYFKQIIALVAIIVLLVFAIRLMKKIQDKPIEPPAEFSEEEFSEEDFPETEEIDETTEDINEENE